MLYFELDRKEKEAFKFIRFLDQKELDIFSRLDTINKFNLLQILEQIVFLKHVRETQKDLACVQKEEYRAIARALFLNCQQQFQQQIGNTDLTTEESMYNYPSRSVKVLKSFVLQLKDIVNGYPCSPAPASRMSCSHLATRR